MAASNAAGDEVRAAGDPRQTSQPRALADRVRRQVSYEMNTQKNLVTDALDSLADTVRRVGEPLHEAPYSALGGYTEDAAKRIERLAADLRRRDVRQLAREVGEFARRSPAVFVGAGLAAGLLAGRVLKSSRPGEDLRGNRRPAAGTRRRAESAVEPMNRDAAAGPEARRAPREKE